MPQKKSLDVTRKKQRRRTLPSGKTVFAPGVSGNPAGRPVGAKSFTVKVREALATLSQAKDTGGVQMSYEAALVKTVLKMAIVDERSDIVKLIWNYLDGMPVQPIDPVNPFVSELDADTKAKIDNIFNRNMKRPK
jgi:hypothetical protein